MSQDAAVFHKDMLDKEFRKIFRKPWLMEEPSGRITTFNTENQACMAQRNWRKENGLNEITGMVQS